MRVRRGEAPALTDIGTIGKVLGALLSAGGVAAIFGGNGILASVLIGAGAMGAAAGVLVDARVNALANRKALADTEATQRQAVAARERAISEALRVSVCTIAEVHIQDIGVDAVDPRILAQALQVEVVP